MIATAYPVTGSAGNHPNTPGKMRSDQRPTGRFNGKRPFQQRQATPQRNQGFDSNGPTFKIAAAPIRYSSGMWLSPGKRRSPATASQRKTSISMPTTISASAKAAARAVNKGSRQQGPP